jgi:hypothetical protein
MKSEYAQVKFVSFLAQNFASLQQIGHGIYIKLRLILILSLVFMTSTVQGVYLLAYTTGLQILHGRVSVEW